MSSELFEHLLAMVAPFISKKDTRFRKCFSVAERLALTLRFLAAGDAQQSLSFSYRLGKYTVRNIIRETCETIYQGLEKNYLNPSGTPEQWQKIADQFKENWNMSNLIVAIDGKHIECSKLSGTQYYNYKGVYIIVLLVICDANCCFTLFNSGQLRSNNDSRVLANSELGQLLEQNRLNLPFETNLITNDNCTAPYFLLGDEIFPLKKWVMRPHSALNAGEEERVYKYRHSRERRVIKNTFGILKSRWRILKKNYKSYGF